MFPIERLKAIVQKNPLFRALIVTELIVLEPRVFVSMMKNGTIIPGISDKILLRTLVPLYIVILAIFSPASSKLS